MKVLAKSLVVAGLSFGIAAAQNLEETMQNLGVAAGKAYVAPIVSGFGTNLNAGWYHKAPAATKFGFHVEAGVVGMGTLLSGGSKTMNVTGGFKLNADQARELANGSVDTTQVGGLVLRDSLAAALRRADQTVTFNGPTIIGSEDDALTFTVATSPFTFTKPGGGDTTITLAAYGDTIPGVTGLLDGLPALPLFAPQLTVGTIYGTNLTLRWLPEVETTEEIGSVKFFGFGIQHNPAVWLGASLPVDLSIGYFMQTLEVGSLFKARSQALGLNASKTFGWRFLNLTPYGGVQVEGSSFDFAYDLVVDGEEIPIEFSLEGENKFRATAGVSLRLLALNINADYNLGKYSSYSFGVMVGI